MVLVVVVVQAVVQVVVQVDQVVVDLGQVLPQVELEPDFLMTTPDILHKE